MKNIFILFLVILTANITLGQDSKIPSKAKIMTLGVFHFNYPNLDAIKTDEKDKISVLDEPFHSEILRICEAIEEFKPTIIAVELTPQNQHTIDSLFNQYKNGNWELKKNEVYQLGFRIGKNIGLEKIYCVDNVGRHYPTLDSIFKDSVRLNKFENYYLSNQDSVYRLPSSNKKIISIIDALIEANDDNIIKEGYRFTFYIRSNMKKAPGILRALILRLEDGLTET
jgi:ABC-type transport system substrate-binding protein